MVYFGRVISFLAATLAGLLAFLFGWRLDEWLACAELPADRPRLLAWRGHAACHHRPLFGGGTFIQAKAA